MYAYTGYFDAKVFAPNWWRRGSLEGEFVHLQIHGHAHTVIASVTQRWSYVAPLDLIGGVGKLDPGGVLHALAQEPQWQHANRVDSLRAGADGRVSKHVSALGRTHALRADGALLPYQSHIEPL